MHSKSDTWSKRNEFLHLVMPLAAHQCDGLEAVWFGDEQVELRADEGSGHRPYSKTPDESEYVAEIADDTATPPTAGPATS